MIQAPYKTPHMANKEENFQRIKKRRKKTIKNANIYKYRTAGKKTEKKRKKQKKTKKTEKMKKKKEQRTQGH